MPIEVKNLHVWLKGDHVLKGVEMSIERKTLLLGPNGSGKTTLIKAILGMLNIDEGDIIIDGRSVRTIEKWIHVMSTNLVDAYSILPENIRTIVKLYEDLLDLDTSLFSELVEMFGIKEVLPKTLYEISTGQKKLVTLSLAISARGRYMVLDEPFEDVDPGRKKRILDIILGTESTVLLSTHELWMIKLFRDWDCYFMLSGRAYGPVRVSDLLEARLVRGDREGALLTFDLGGEKISIVKNVNEGIPLSELSSMEKMFEILYEAPVAQ
ncbi:MAG: ATP-binding cassette domain-containing protein [Crenarchaeota archaeon]|nr:ATP-binding cassette domain-containing protein [Thermoproteota archaeon]